MVGYIDKGTDDLKSGMSENINYHFNYIFLLKIVI